jgi:hypothetical protein
VISDFVPALTIAVQSNGGIVFAAQRARTPAGQPPGRRRYGVAAPLDSRRCWTLDCFTTARLLLCRGLLLAPGWGEWAEALVWNPSASRLTP